MRFLLINPKKNVELDEVTSSVATYYNVGKNDVLDIATTETSYIEKIREMLMSYYLLDDTTKIILLDASNEHQFHVEWNGEYNIDEEPIDSDGCVINEDYMGKLNSIQSSQFTEALKHITQEEIFAINAVIEDNFG